MDTVLYILFLLRTRSYKFSIFIASRIYKLKTDAIFTPRVAYRVMNIFSQKLGN